MADRKDEKQQSRFRDMTKLITILFIMYTTLSYSQRKPIRAWQKEDVIHYYLYFPGSDYYNREIMATPLQQVTIKENFNNLQEDKFVREFYEWAKRKFEPTLEDTLIISEKDIAYIKGEYRYSETINKYNIKETYDSIVIQNKTKDTLNGFYKVNSSPPNKKYDYYLGYFFKGDPYVRGGSNIFEYYKNKKLYKCRFFVHTLFPTKMNFSYDQITEDYFPITKKKWRREIKTWPDEELLVEDTVVYKKNRAYIDGIQKIYNIREYKTYKPETIKTKRLLYKTHHYKKGRIQSVTEYSYHPFYQNFALQQIKELDIPKRVNMTAEIQEYDPAGRLLYRGGFENVPVNHSDKEKCPNGRYKFDKYYTGIEPDEQCFQPVGEHYELDPDYVYSKRKTTFKLDSLTLVYQAYFEKGLLVKFMKKRLFPIENLDDSLTQKVYGKTVIVYKEEVTDYKKRMSTTEYFKYPNKKLIIRIKKKYENCIEIYFPKRGWYKAYCEDEFLRREYGERYKSKQFIEYYDPSGKKIIDNVFTGKYEDFLNNYQKN